MARDLATRVQDRAQAPATTSQEPPSVGRLLEQMKPEFARALPKHMDAERMTRLALTQFRTVRNLANCSPESFLGAIMTCAQLGLEPGVSGEAYLVPYGRECTLIVGYKGMAKLFWQSPLAKSLDAQAVFENDDFDYEYGLTPMLRHKPLLRGDRGQVIAYYAVATLNNGGSAFVVLSRDDVEKIRKRSRAKDNGPWATDYDAMAKKTAVRQLFKLLPASTELTQAIAHDETARTDTRTEVIDQTPPPPMIEGRPVDTTTGEIGAGSTGEDYVEEPPPGWEPDSDDEQLPVPA